MAIWCYARNVVAAAAADGARLAATAPDGPAVGAQRAGELIRSGLNAAAAARIPCAATASADPATGLPTRTVRCHGRLAMTFLPFPLPLGIDVHSSALVEAGP